MKEKTLKISIFVLSFVCLIISLKLFWNLAIYVDEFNTSPDVVLGGEFWLSMNWLKLFLSGAICLLSGISLFNDKAV